MLYANGHKENTEVIAETIVESGDKNYQGNLTELDSF
jgi:hypothetical protein